MSIDQSGTIHNYVQNWRESAKDPADQMSVNHSLDQSHEGPEGLIRPGDWV